MLRPFTPIRAIRYWDVDADGFRSFDFPGADDVGNIFQSMRDCNDYYVGIRDLAATRKLNPELKTFREWLKENASRIPMPA